MKLFSIIKSILSILAVLSVFITTNLMANSCSKADIDYYLQRGFSHQQVVQLCSATATPQAHNPAQSSNNTAPYPAPAAPVASTASGSYQLNSLREDQVFLEAALNAKNVKLTPQSLSYDAKECVEYGHPNMPDLNDQACVLSKVTVSLPGLKILKTRGGIFLIKDAEFLVQGNIQRTYLNYDSVRRQEKSSIRSLLPNNPSKINIPIRRNMDPSQIAGKLKKYI